MQYGERDGVRGRALGEPEGAFRGSLGGMKRTSRRPRRNPSPLDNPAFRRWFGDSKVVDERGEPLVVYHGTNAHAYSPGERIEVFGTGSRGGAFFSSDPRIASQYGERVYAVYLRLESPLVLHAAGRGWTDLRGSSRAGSCCARTRLGRPRAWHDP